MLLDNPCHQILNTSINTPGVFDWRPIPGDEAREVQDQILTALGELLFSHHLTVHTACIAIDCCGRKNSIDRVLD